MNASRIIFYLLAESDTDPAKDLREAIGRSRVNDTMWPIYRMVAPQNETAPFITFHQSGEAIDHAAHGIKVRTANIQVNVWATTPDDVDEIAELVVPCLDNVFGSVDGQLFDNILYSNNIETFEPNLDPPLFGRQLEFQIRIAQ